MRRIFTLLTILALTCAGSLQAQVLKKSTFKHAVTTNTRRANIATGENQVWWGYMGDATDVYTVGIGDAATYHSAIYLPGNHDVAGGKKLCGIRIGLTAPHATNLTVWVASSLPQTPSASNTLWMTTLSSRELGEVIEVSLSNPITISGNGVYVGYSFTITNASTKDDQYPIQVIGNDEPNGLLMRFNNYDWADYNGNGFGVLNLKVLLEGEFTDYMVSAKTKQTTYYAQVNESADVDVVLTNNGLATANSIAYTITNNGVTSEEQTVTFDTPIKPFKTASFTANVAADAVACSSVRTLTITKVNGESNTSQNASTQFVFKTLDRLIPRNVVVEEFTGTGCGYCPRGLVGMEKLRQTFGDRFIGIGIHQYNTSDAMYIANYPYLDFGGAPSCRIDRGDVIDPYYGSSNDICDDFRAEMNIPAMVDVKVFGTVDDDLTEVKATATVEPLFDTSDYNLELALVADGLSGSTSAWWQSNYYSSASASQQPADLAIFCKGGKYGQSTVKNYVFNDVAVGTSYNQNGVNQAPALGTMTGGEKRKVSYTLSLPTKATLRTALKKSTATIYVVALVIDKDGTIANAAKTEVLFESELPVVMGDVNGDGQVGIGDIISVTNFMAGTSGEVTLEQADVNGDGEVGIGDIITITNIMAGVETR